ncbi:tetratricopeptide repeat protein [Candidatus Pelagibacter sp. HIMB1593]|uniref:tetratricopeptide repeat protein n=1 Tax=Candidatus Pelagibacter sp. HIMB1593 TaxID=3413355 RepID=UPI003F83B855
MDLNKALILAHEFLISGKINEAENKFNEILKYDPQNLHALNNLGNIYIQKKNFSKGILFFEKCLKINENFFQAQINKGTCHQNLKQYSDALDSYKKTLEIKPDFIEAYFNIGNCLLKLNKYEDAILNYDKILEKKPKNINAIFNKGLCFEKLEKFEIALKNYNQIIQIEKKFFIAHLHKGNCLKQLHCFQEAIDSYNKAIEIGSNSTNFKSVAKYSLGCLQLLMGNYKDGWKNYEYRKKEKFEFSQTKEWKGEQNLQGKSIFIHNEQGFGDYIQFIRYLPMLKKLGAKIILNTPNKLLPLIKSMNVEFEIIDINRQDQLNFDYYCSILSLPFNFKTSIDNIPNAVPYLKVNEKIKEFWKKKISKTKKNIGIKWTGNKNYLDDKNRSTNLNQLKSLFDLPIDFHSLEIEYSTEDSFFKKNTKNLYCYDKELMDFEYTAGLIENMDLIITTDTSIAHLSGALNKSTWIMLPKLPDFRWLINRRDSPWYPSFKLYRQDKIRSWNNVIKKIKEDLK